MAQTVHVGVIGLTRGLPEVLLHRRSSRLLVQYQRPRLNLGLNLLDRAHHDCYADAAHVLLSPESTKQLRTSAQCRGKPPIYERVDVALGGHPRQQGRRPELFCHSMVCIPSCCTGCGCEVTPLY